MDCKEKRKEFMKDLHNLLETHKRFIDNPEYEDDQGDAFDFILDDCQNLYVKWVLGK